MDKWQFYGENFDLDQLHSTLIAIEQRLPN
jgi:hypothetical protein